MSRIIFYDPDNYHDRSVLDPTIIYPQCSQCLCRCISSNTHISQVLILCCSDLSIKIEKVQEISESILINLCREHGGRETNPTYHPNVRSDIVFNPNRQWEFDCRLDGMKRNNMNGLNEEVLYDLQILKMIKREALSNPRTKVQVQDQNENIPLNRPLEGASSEETEEIEH